MARTATVNTEEANISFDYEGDGQPLLTIAGEGVDAISYAMFLLPFPPISLHISTIQNRVHPLYQKLYNNESRSF